MKKKEIIEKLMSSEYWEDIYVKYARKGMEKSTKKELLKDLKEVMENEK